MITQRVRVTLDFDVTVHEQPERVHDVGYDLDADYEREWRERQQRLLDAMISDPQMLRRWILSCVLDEFHGGSVIEEHLSKHMPKEDEEDKLFREAVTKLSENDREYWQDCEARTVFAENSEEVSAALVVEVADARLEELQPEHA